MIAETSASNGAEPHVTLALSTNGLRTDEISTRRTESSVNGSMKPSRVWFTEYAGDGPLREFAEAGEFEEMRRFHLANGAEVVTFCKQIRPEDTE